MKEQTKFLTSDSIGAVFTDGTGNFIEIFKECTTCCNGVKYYGYIEGDPSDSYFAYNQEGLRYNHKGEITLEGKLILEN